MNNRLVSRGALLLAMAASICGLGGPAQAALFTQLPTTILEPAEGDPIVIDMCAVQTPAGAGIIGEKIDFHNISTKVVTDIKLYIVLKDAFGTNAFAMHVAHGSYAPSVAIRGISYTNSVQQPYVKAYCTVGAAIFEDGTKWSAGKGFLRGINATPAPSPSPSPSLGPGA